MEDFLYNLIMMTDVRIFFFLPQRIRFDVVHLYIYIYTLYIKKSISDNIPPPPPSLFQAAKTDWEFKVLVCMY